MREIEGAERPSGLRSMAVAVLGASTLLIGCVTVATKDALADKDNYMANNFSPAQLSPAIRTKIDSGEAIPDRFRTLRLAYVIQTEDEGKNSEITSVVDLTNLGNGYVQSRAEFAKNSVPYRVNLALTFGGIYRLKTQTLFLGRPNALLPNETKEVGKFDRGLANPKKGSNYVIESTTGTSAQLANFLPENFSCTAKEPTPAAAVFPSLSGEVLPVDCTVVGLNNVVVSKMSFWWLADYGVSIQKEVVDSRSKSKYSLTAFSATR